jgi:hypothetical protein
MQPQQLPPTAQRGVQHELLSAGWPCSEFSNSGISVRVLHRPSDSLHSIFTGDLEFDSDSGIDSSGLDVWSGACALMCSHIATNPAIVSSLNVLELGSGMGVCGLFAAQTRFAAQNVALTDAGNFVMKVRAAAPRSAVSLSLQVLAANLAMNAPNCIAACHVFEHSWGRYCSACAAACCFAIPIHPVHCNSF